MFTVLPISATLAPTPIYKSIGIVSQLVSHIFVSSVRSSCTDDGPLYIRKRQWQQLFQIFTQSIDSIDVTSVTLGHLNSINAIDVIRC